MNINMNDLTKEEMVSLLAALTSQINSLMALHLKVTKLLAGDAAVFNDLTKEEMNSLLTALTGQMNPLMSLHQKLTKLLLDAGVISPPPNMSPPVSPGPMFPPPPPDQQYGPGR